MLSACLAAAGQQQPSPVDADDGRDDLIFTVRLTAKELKMEIVPSPTVVFPGTHRRTTLWLTERQNLPDKIEPGVTYRDIGITLRISSRFENIDQIVREALGEQEPPKPDEPKPAEPAPPAPKQKPTQPEQR